MRVTAEDCPSCGACCVNPYWDGSGQSYAALFDKDFARLQNRLGRRRAARLTIIDQSSGEFRTMRSKVARFRENGQEVLAETCIALDGRLGKDVTCRIYADRPTCCREFKPGSEGCLEARKALLP